MGINMVREKYIRKGFIQKSQIMYFFGCGYKVALTIYDQIKKETIADGKIVNDNIGVRTTRLINMLDMSEDDILRLAEEERKKDATTNKSEAS